MHITTLKQSAAVTTMLTSFPSTQKNSFPRTKSARVDYLFQKRQLHLRTINRIFTSST